LRCEAVVTADPVLLGQADKLILPGVGSFRDGMANLRALNLIDPLTRMVNAGKPILGICLGAQLLTKSSEEFGDNHGLGWVDAVVQRLQPDQDELRVPHVGWNDLEQTKASLLFDGISENTLFYYVHSFAIQANDPEIVIGTCEYGQKFVAALQSGHIYGTQFHPEKSQQGGLTLLQNFIEHG
jgi:glutamine amidotransferase